MCRSDVEKFKPSRKIDDVLFCFFHVGVAEWADWNLLYGQYALPLPNPERGGLLPAFTLPMNMPSLPLRLYSIP